MSKLLSLVLRHDPSRFGVDLDGAGWVEASALLAALEAHGASVSREELDALLASGPKRRFEASADGLRVRATHGHSVPVEFGLAPTKPPEVLYHGTVARSLDSIRRDGLKPGARVLVHLAATREDAVAVGSRRGPAVVLEVRAGAMARAGESFFLASSGTWLVRAVPPQHIGFPDGTSREHP